VSCRLVIFDCDGVLVDSERLTVEVESRVLTELGWPISPDDVARRFAGRSSDDNLAEIEQHLGPEHTRDFDRISTDQIVAAFHDRLEAIPGVRELVEALHERGVLTHRAVATARCS
jgi:beta-phosphoglucomutase-like phosphatase (HAD superfamily)